MRMKKASSLILATLLLQGLLSFFVFPVHATQTYTWSKPRPTIDRIFNETVGNATTDGETSVGLGVEILKYYEGSGSPDDPDHLRLHVDASANTRRGISYYYSSLSGYSWAPVSNPTGITGDNSGTWLNLGFTLLYYGLSYTRIWVSSNGFICLTSNFTGANPQPIPSNSTHNAIIAPFWRDLEPNLGGSITYGTITPWPLAASGLSFFVVSWNNVPDASGNNQTFQVLIEERHAGDEAYPNTIFFQYQSITKGPSTSVGVEDPLGYQGTSIDLTELNNGACKEIDPGGNNLGSRLESLEILLTKSDGSASLLTDPTYISGYNVVLNATNTKSYGTEWTPVIGFASDLLIGGAVEAGSDILTFGAGVAIQGLICLYEISADSASEVYKGAAQQYSNAGTSSPQAYVLANCNNQTINSGEYNGEPFDASLASDFYWEFNDHYPQNVPHTLNVTVDARYFDYGTNRAYDVCTWVTLNLYTGYHYVDLHTVLVPNGETTGVTVLIGGNSTYSPVESLILPQGTYKFQVDSTIYRNSVKYTFLHWQNGSMANPLNVAVDSDINYTAYYIGWYNLTISVMGVGTTTPAPGTYTFEAGTVQPVTANETLSGHPFVFWMLDGTNGSTSNPITVTMNCSHSLTAYFGAPKKGGCPYLYVWNGEEYVLDNNVLPAAETSNGTDVQDYFTLDQTPSPVYNGTLFSAYSLQIGESENEHDFIDQVKLFAVDHQSGVNVAVTQDGEILTYQHPNPPLSAVDNNGTSRLNEVLYMDGNVSDPSTYFYGKAGDYLTLNFGNLTSSTAKLILRDDMKCADVCINVQVLNASGPWQNVTTLHPRAFWSIEAVDLSAYVIKDRSFYVRLVWTSPHRLDYVGLDTSPNQPVHVENAYLIWAWHSQDGSILWQLLKKDGVYAELTPGQQIQLTFLLPNDKNEARTFIFYTVGHYYTITT